MPFPITCPQRNAELEQGSITGQGVYLNWIPQGAAVGWISLGKEHLASGSVLSPPMLAAARCESCGLGVLSSDRPRSP